MVDVVYKYLLEFHPRSFSLVSRLASPFYQSFERKKKKKKVFNFFVLKLLRETLFIFGYVTHFIKKKVLDI